MADGTRRPLVLASASPYRRRMLESAGLSFQVEPAAVDEAALKWRLAEQGISTPGEIARALAGAKAEAVSGRLPQALVIGADQVLELDGRLLDKPGGAAAAREQLMGLRGKTHRLLSGCALAEGGKTVWDHVDVATLTMRAFTTDFLDRYLAEAGDRLCGIVGAYEIEGAGIQLFENVSGDYFTIIGLPLLPLLAQLRLRGVVAS
jgi:septum formation protein